MFNARYDLNLDPAEVADRSADPGLAAVVRGQRSSPSHPPTHLRALAVRAGTPTVAHARLFCLWRTLSVRTLADVNVGAIGSSGHSQH